MGYEVALSPLFIKTLYRRLIRAGYTPKEAGNLVAKVMGLVASEKGWTVKQLTDLLFLQYIDKNQEK